MKDYRERLEKYRNYQMSPEEAQAFEQELADAASLFDDLLEKEELAALEDYEKNQQEQVQQEKDVKKKIRRRYLKMVALVIVVVSLIVGGGVYLVPKAIDSYYYNPAEGQVEGSSYERYQPSDFEVYQRVLNQVNVSENRLVSTHAYHSGAGTYQISQSFIDDFNQSYFPRMYTLNRNQLQDETNYGSSDANYYGGVLAEVNLTGDSEFSGADDLASRIADLPDSAWVKLEVRPKSQSWAAISELINNHPEITFYSGKIVEPSVNSGEYMPSSFNVGVRFGRPQSTVETVGNLYVQSQIYNSEYQNKLEEDYPKLFRLNGQFGAHQTEEELRQYLSSNLQYLVDHQEDSLDTYRYPASDFYEELYGEDFDQAASDKAYYDNLIEAVETGDLKFDSLLIALPKDLYADFVNGDNFYTANLLDVLMFRY